MKSTLATLAAATTVNGCFEHVDYPGQDIKKTVNIHSSEECQAICRETEGCSTFTWSPSEAFCWSKYVAAGRIEHEGRVSGPAFCPGEIIVEPTPESIVDEGPCVEEGFDYFGNDIKSSDNVHSLEACKAQCQQTEGCTFFTWSPPDGHCWSKFSAQGRRENSNRISGRASCGEEPTAEPTAEPTSEPTMEPTMIPTSEPTMLPTPEETLLPTAEPTMIPTVEASLEPTVEPTTEECYSYNIAYRSNDEVQFSVAGIHSAPICQELCQLNESCNFWTWYSYNKHCEIHNSVSGDMVKDAVVSGTRFCNAYDEMPAPAGIGAGAGSA